MFNPPCDTRVYIDGFNLYFSMKERGWRKHYWLDVHKLAIKLLQKARSLGFVRRDQQVESVRYYTSRIGESGRDSKKAARQSTYLEALEAHNRTVGAKLSISFGQYQTKPHTCEHCKREILLPVEKMTDVNLATDLLVDAFYDKYRTAIVISGDSDLTAPVKAVGELFAEKRVIVAIPPDRWSKSLTDAAYRFLLIEERYLQQCQLPESVLRKDEYVLMRPALWK